MVKRISELVISEATMTGRDVTVSHVISEMSRLGVREMLVMGEKDKPIGMITRHSLIDAGTNPEMTKVKTFMFKPPMLRLDNSVEDAARLMKEAGVECLPVLDKKDKLAGVLLIDEIIKNLDAGDLRVEEVMSRNPLAVDEDVPIVTARAMMKNHGISRLPVVDGNGLVVGMVTASDIVRRSMTKPRERERKRDTVEEKIASLSNPVKSIMSGRVVGCSPDHKVREAIRKMTDHNLRLLPVLKGGKPVGLISKKIILGLYATPGPEGINVVFSGPKDMETFEILELKNFIADRIRKLGKLMQSGEVEISMKKIGASKVEVKLRAAEGKKLKNFTVSSVAFDPEAAISEALRMLERKVRNY